MTIVVNRRERVRAATVQEIKDVARAQLVALGPGAVSLRAIAREMGMTAPALYRYFPSFDHLVRALVIDMFDEVCAAMARARDSVDAQDPAARLVAAGQAFRQWAIAHRAEFGLIFGNPLPAQSPVGGEHEHDVMSFGASRCGHILITIFEQLWQRQPYPVPSTHNIAADLWEQLSAYRTATQTTLPVGALNVAMNVWLRLFGMVSLEVFGHIPFAPHDAATFFSQQLADIMAGLSATREPVLPV